MRRMQVISGTALLLLIVASIAFVQRGNADAGSDPFAHDDLPPGLLTQTASVGLPTITIGPGTARADTVLTSTPGSSDAAVITDVLVESYRIGAQGRAAFDLSEYAAIFTNDTSVPLLRWQADYLTKVRARYGNAVPELSKNGFLAYEVALAYDFRVSKETYARVQATAKAEGRLATTDELRSSFLVNGQPPPSGVYTSAKKVRVNVLRIKIVGNRADVEYDDSASTRRAVLINTANGWRIAGSKVTASHF